MFEQTHFDHTQDGINLATQTFSDLLNEISLRSLKLHCQKKARKKTTLKKWFDQECFQLRKTLTELSNKKHRNPFDESLRQDYYKVRKKFKKLINFKKTKLLNSKIDNLIKHKGNHEFWSYLKSLNETDKNVTNGMLEAPIDKLYDHFENLHSKPKSSSLSEFHLSVLNDKSALEQQKDDHNYLDDPFSIDEVETTRKLLKSGKAPGPDRIRNEMLKTGSPHLKSAICKLFNHILTSGYFPQSWCEGVITPIFKSGDKQDPANYWGICINSCLGKLFSAVLNNRLKNFVEDHNILHKAQIGFMSNHRTTDHIFADKCVTHTTKGKLYTRFIDLKRPLTQYGMTVYSANHSDTKLE